MCNPVIAVEAIRAPWRPSRVVAEVDVRVGPVLVRGVKCIEGRAGPFLGLPSRKIGVDTYEDIVELDEQLAGRALLAVQVAVAAWLAEAGR